MARISPYSTATQDFATADLEPVLSEAPREVHAAGEDGVVVANRANWEGNDRSQLVEPYEKNGMDKSVLDAIRKLLADDLLFGDGQIDANDMYGLIASAIDLDAITPEEWPLITKFVEANRSKMSPGALAMFAEADRVIAANAANPARNTALLLVGREITELMVRLPVFEILDHLQDAGTITPA